jgi:hypothetical protein
MRSLFKVFYFVVVLLGVFSISANEDKNNMDIPYDYQQIANLTSGELDGLWNEYCSKINRDYFDVEEYTEFLNQFVKLENLQIWADHSSSRDYETLSKISLILPKLKSLAIRGINFNNLHWISHCENLQELDIDCIEEGTVDLAHLEKFQKLTKVHIVNYNDIVNADKVPLSVKDLALESYNGKIQNADFKKHHFISLKLNASCIKSLPSKACLEELEYLDISHSSIIDLTPIKDNGHLKSLIYNGPDINTSYVIDYSPIATLSHLEELQLRGFAQSEKELKVIFEKLPKLQKLCLTEKFDDCINDLSFLEGRSFAMLTIDEKLIDLIPQSILLNQNLKELCVIGGTSINHDSWTRLPLHLDKLTLDLSDCDLSKLTNFKIKALDIWEVDGIQNGDKMVEIAPNLEILSMRGDAFDQLVETYQDSFLESFQNLQVLDLDYICENIHSLDFLKKLPTLKVVDIDCEWATIKPDDFNVFRELKNLTKIKLWALNAELIQKVKELQKEGIPIFY